MLPGPEQHLCVRWQAHGNDEAHEADQDADDAGSGGRDEGGAEAPAEGDGAPGHAENVAHGAGLPGWGRAAPAAASPPGLGSGPAGELPSITPRQIRFVDEHFWHVHWRPGSSS